jgi:hypothetical protein
MAMNREGQMDRRNDHRFHMQDIAFAVLRNHVSKVGQIMDISLGGLSFHYIVNGEDPHRSLQMDILLAYQGIRIKKIRFKAISDIRIANKSPFSPLLIRRCGVRFGPLTEEQKSQLENFIRNHAVERWNPNHWGEAVRDVATVNEVPQHQVKTRG